MAALVQTTKISFGFQLGRPVLREVTFAVETGERVAFMGQSGAGKTTLLKLIAGLAGYAPESGAHICGGRFALVFQQPLLLDHLNVRDNIRLPSIIRHCASNCEETAEMLGIEHLLQRYPFQLSGGQQRRVALARALASPDVAGLLLDEPFTGLDEPLRERIIRSLLAVLERTGLTCILSTHSPLEACLLADRVIFLGGAPATIIGEHVIDLPRDDRIAWLDKPEFFQEMTTIRGRLGGTATDRSANGEESGVYAVTAV